MTEPKEIIQDGTTYIRVGEGVYYKFTDKNGNFFTGNKKFEYYPCKCGRLISNSGWAFTKHWKSCKSVEEGKGE